jgi:hypothetical protein
VAAAEALVGAAVVAVLAAAADALVNNARKLQISKGKQ